MRARLTPEALAAFRRVYYHLAPQSLHSVLLDSCGWTGKTGGFYVMGFETQSVIQLKRGVLWVDGREVETIPDKATLWEALSRYFPTPEAETIGGAEALPFVEGWIGAVGYELNHLLEPSLPVRYSSHPMGELYWARFRHRVLWQPETGQLEILSEDPAWKRRVTDLFSRAHDLPDPEPPRQTSVRPEVSLNAASFAEQVEKIQAHIVAGDIYQANLSLRFSVTDYPVAGLLGLYHQLVTQNPSPFSGILLTPEGAIVSNSPERLVKANGVSGLLEARPLAGTRGRGKTPAEEARIDALLLTDPKEQAEHLMLVDLERNDLGRVAEPGSVHVPELGVLERYSHVTHIVSQVEGRLAPHTSPWQVLEAMFPGGTITGCPKVRCMAILAEAEPVPRGFYTGSLGYLDSRGHLDFNILIRSLFHQPEGRLDFHAGAGIVYDSQAAGEYRECYRKAEAIQGVLHHDPLLHLA